MANSYLEYTGTGALQTLTVPDYIDRSHITVYVGGVATTSFSWVTASTIQLTAANGAAVRIVRRSSPNARVTDYTDGVPLTEAALDADSKQAFYLAQEQLDATAEMLGVVDDLPATLSQMSAYEASCAASAASAASAATTAANAALASKADKGSLTTSGLTVNTARLAGRTTAGSGALEEISVGARLSLSGGTLNVQAASTGQEGAVSLANSTEVQTGTDAAKAPTIQALRSGWRVLMAQQAASGSQVDFNSIPSWATKIRVMFDGVSLNGTDNLLVQLGTAGSVEATGYTSTSGYIQNASSSGTTTSTAGMVIAAGAAVATFIGVLELELMDPSTNLWMATSVGTRGDIAVPIYGAGRKALSGALTRVRVTRTGTDSFDAGNLRVSYE